MNNAFSGPGRTPSRLAVCLCLSLVLTSCEVPHPAPQILPEYRPLLEKTFIWGAGTWEDKDGVRRHSRVLSETEDGIWSISYFFDSEKALQVHADFPMATTNSYGLLSLDFQGDGTANQFEIWTESIGRWLFQKRALPLSETGWQHLEIPVRATPTDVMGRFRIVVVQKAGAGEGRLSIKNVCFSGEAPAHLSVLPPLFGRVPPGLPYLETPPAFSVSRERVGDRNVFMIDGEPLVCALDTRLDYEFIRNMREAGVTTHVIDMYWKDLEPRKGHRDWGRLGDMIEAYRQCGVSLFFIINIHQPSWLLQQLSDEPQTSMQCVYPNHPVVKQAFSAYLGEFVRETARFPNVLGYALSAGAEADLDFPEVPGEMSPWRESPAMLHDYRAFLQRKYETVAELRSAWEDVSVDFESAVPPVPPGPFNRSWREFRQSAHDFSEFKDRFWVDALEWQAKVIRSEAPDKWIIARLSWPVFQGFNPFLARDIDFVDLLQVKDAVPSFEAESPHYLRSRAAIFAACVRGTDAACFPEIDVGHNRGKATSEDIAFYLPQVAPFAGGVWFYRNVKPGQFEGLKEGAAEFRRKVMQPRHAEVAVFYGQKRANWVTQHEEYVNEDSLAGAVRALDMMDVHFDVVSEYTLGDLESDKYRALIIPDGEFWTAEAAAAVEKFIKTRPVLATKVAAVKDLSGRSLSPRWKSSATLLPEGAFRRIRPRGEDFQLTPDRLGIIHQIRVFIEAAGVTVSKIPDEGIAP